MIKWVRKKSKWGYQKQSCKFEVIFRLFEEPTSSLSKTWHIIFGVVPITVSSSPAWNCRFDFQCHFFSIYIYDSRNFDIINCTWPILDIISSFRFLFIHQSKKKVVISHLRQHPPPGHDDDQLADVGDVRDRPQAVVHHDLFQVCVQHLSRKKSLSGATRYFLPAEGKLI